VRPGPARTRRWRRRAAVRAWSAVLCSPAPPRRTGRRACDGPTTCQTSGPRGRRRCAPRRPRCPLGTDRPVAARYLPGRTADAGHRHDPRRPRGVVRPQLRRVGRRSCVHGRPPSGTDHRRAVDRRRRPNAAGHPGRRPVAPATRLGVAAVLPARPTPAVVVAPTALVLDASALAATVVPADVASARAVGGAILAAGTAVGAIATAAVISTVIATPVAAPVVAPAAAFAAGAVVAPTAATVVTTGTVLPPATAAVVAARTVVPPATATAVVPAVAATPAGAPVVAPAAAFTAGAIVTRATTTAAAIRPTGVATPAAAASVVTPRRALAPAAATAAGAVVA